MAVQSGQKGSKRKKKELPVILQNKKRNVESTSTKNTQRPKTAANAENGRSKIAKKFHIGSHSKMGKKDFHKSSVKGDYLKTKNQTHSQSEKTFDSKTKKEVKRARKSFKNPVVFETGMAAKKKWEVLRKKSLGKAERQNLATSVFSSLEADLSSYVYAHDTVRVLESIIKTSSKEMRLEVIDKLKDHIVPMAKSKYAKFLVSKMLKYGSVAQRNRVMEAIKGKARPLFCDIQSGEIVEDFYNNYASAEQRMELLRELYAPRIAMYQLMQPGDSQKGNPNTFKDFLEAYPSSRKSALKSCHEFITKLQTKGLLKFTLSHKLLLEFLTAASTDESADLCSFLKDSLVEILHTPDGSKASMMCIWNSSAKDRKVIVKSFKNLLLKICREEYGHKVLISLLDSVDDTVFVRKSLIAAVISNLDELMKDKYGRKVVVYICSPRDPSHFVKETVELLSRGDKNPFSKKESVVRWRELSEDLMPSFVTYFVTNSSALCYESAWVYFTLSFIKSSFLGSEQRAQCVQVVVDECCAEFFPAVDGNVEDMHIIEHPGGHTLVKGLIKSPETGFSQALVSSDQTSDFKIFLTWLRCNRGCLLLTLLLEHCDCMGLRRILTQHLSTIEKTHFPSAKMLLKTVKSLGIA